MTNRKRKQARKRFAKMPHSTRPFTSADYAALPKE